MERRVRLSRALLVWEALLPALWPAAGFAGLFVALALFGFFSVLPPFLHWALLAGSGVLFVAMLWHGFRGFHWPSRGEALRHLERSSGLPHAPLSAYEDVAAENTGDPALWAAHRRWIGERLKRLRIGLPASLLAARDPFALRAAVLLLLVVGIAGTGPGHFDRIANALLPGAAGARAASIEAWITPPAYTGKPPVYLERRAERDGKVETPSIAVPQGSKLSLRVHGLKNAPVLESHGAERGKPEELKTVSDGNYSIDAPLTETAEMALTEGGRMIRAWRIEVTPDAPPTIELTEGIGQSVSKALRFAYKVADDYGVASAQARIALDTSELPEEAQEIDVPQPRVTAPDVALSLPSVRPREAEGETYAELTAHPWAGLPVTITLVAVDDKEQEGEAEAIETVLPAREFTDPLARAIVEQRRRLALDPRSGASVARFIDNFTQDADRYIEDKVVYLSLRAAYWRLTEATRDTDLTGIYDLLWSVALRLEDGDLSLAERDLRDARKALAEALAKGAGNDEIARLMQELKTAFERYMDAVAAQQPGEMPPTAEFQNGDMQTIDRAQLEAMMNAIGELAQNGAREQAQAMLDQLQNILENLQVPDQNARMSPGDKAMSQAIDKMGELIGKQRELMDRTFRETEEPHGQDQSGMPLGMPGGEQPSSEALDGLGGEQRALRDELGEILRALREADTETPDALGEAERSMESAEERLGMGRPDRAAGSQGQAIERMQAGAQALADKLMEGKSGRGRGQAGTDPFGRPMANSGSDFGNDVSVPDKIDMQRARQILEELRARAAELGRPQIELDYLDRLLRRF